ncbi:hypothetical protein KPH14_006187 [Odynerus spinipes]|uniref:Uncharacterized protein n=1 Tax=Odynerus spinipes TaxID=1348599 RepID=A0AAD9VN33_9HYME|nr:hypothetical protein KPH14_006187 [Odynerus spinipes]
MCASLNLTVLDSKRGVWKSDGAGDSETWNGIPESLILLVNKCLGDSLLVHSYRPSFVSRRHCVLRFYLVFRSNGFSGLTEQPGWNLSSISLSPPCPLFHEISRYNRDTVTITRAGPILRQPRNIQPIVPIDFLMKRIKEFPWTSLNSFQHLWALLDTFGHLVLTSFHVASMKRD